MLQLPFEKLLFKGRFLSHTLYCHCLSSFTHLVYFPPPSFYFWQTMHMTVIRPIYDMSIFVQGANTSRNVLWRVDCDFPLSEHWTQNLPFPSFWDAPGSRKQGIRLYSSYSYNPILSNSSHNVCRCVHWKEFPETFADFTFPLSPTPPSTHVEFPQKHQNAEECKQKPRFPIALQTSVFLDYAKTLQQ